MAQVNAVRMERMFFEAWKRKIYMEVLVFGLRAGRFREYLLRPSIAWSHDSAEPYWRAIANICVSVPALRHCRRSWRCAPELAQLVHMLLDQSSRASFVASVIASLPVSVVIHLIETGVSLHLQRDTNAGIRATDQGEPKQVLRYQRKSRSQVYNRRMLSSRHKLCKGSK